MKIISEKLKDLAEPVFLWPLFGGVTTIFGVIAGYLGSHYHTEIWDASWPWRWFVAENFPFEALGFWAAACAFGASFTVTFWAQSRRSNRTSAELQAATNQVSTKADALSVKTTEVSSKADDLATETSQVSMKADDLVKKTNELDGLIRQLYTLPPKGFLFRYGNTCHFSNKIFFSAQVPEATADDVAYAIRRLLKAVLDLASLFDSDGNKAIYGCNLMVFRPSNSLSDGEVEALNNRMKFVGPAETVTRLKGVLDMVLPLSVSSLNPEGPDLKLTAFALPVPCPPANNGDPAKDSSVLPGAPLAFVSKSEAVIESPEDWLKRATPFSQKVQEELQQFFENQHEVIQSFVSIPLYAETATDGEDPIGILNIHRNMPNTLLAEKLELFSPLLVPIAILIGRLLDTYACKGGIVLVNKESTNGN